MQLNMLDQVVKQEAMSSEVGMLCDELVAGEVEDVPSIATAAAVAAGWIVPDSLTQIRKKV